MFRKLAILVSLASALVASNAFAQRPTYGDWTVDLEHSAYLGAYTTNRSGSLFGFICSVAADHCVYYLTTHTTCDPQATSLILINTASGAIVSSVTCTKINGTYYNAIKNTHDVDEAVVESLVLGIAIPLKSGQFKVVRFSLIGAKEATKSVVEHAQQIEKFTDHVK